MGLSMKNTHPMCVSGMKLSRKQLAKILGVSVDTIRNWEEQKIIPYLQVGHVIRFDLAKVEKALEKFERKALA
jgi:excisionase family DNA binding protein